MRRAAAALALGVALALAVELEAKPPTITCDPGYVPECVLAAPSPTRTATKSPTSSPTKTPTAAPATPTVAPTATAPPSPTSTPAGDVLPPTLKILDPLSGASIPAGAYMVKAEASDNVGVASVKFEHNGALKCVVTVPPYECGFNMTTPSATVGVRAFDAAGNSQYRENNVSVVASVPVTPIPTTPISTPSPLLGTPTPVSTPSPTSSPGTATPPPQAQQTPIPPQAVPDVSLPTVSGTVRTVAAGGNLQQALDAAVPGDVVELAAGATFTGGFRVKVKPQSTLRSLGVAVGLAAPLKVWIRSSKWQSLSPQGTRAKPADAPFMAKIVGPGGNVPPIAFELGASNYYLTGLEVTTTTNVTTLVSLGVDPNTSGSATALAQLPDQVVFDRVWIHGTPTVNVRRGITSNVRAFAVVDSTIDEIHEDGADNQAVGGWNAAGPMLLRNNMLSAACENFMLGGADAAIANLTPSDITIVKNHIFKPLRWNPNDPSFDGSHWSVKNLFELKHAQRVLVEGNVFENWWLAGQTFAIALTVRNQQGTNPWATVQDVLFSKNKFTGIDGSGVNFLAHDGPSSTNPSQRMVRMQFRNNLFEFTPSSYPATLQFLAGAYDVGIFNNTFVRMNRDSGTWSFSAAPTGNPAPDERMQRFIGKDNIFGAGKYGMAGDNDGTGSAALNTYAPGAVFTGNVIFGPYPTSGGVTQGCCFGSHPGNLFPADQAAVGFVDLAGRNYHIAPSSPYYGKGADIDALESAIAGVVK